MLFSFQLNYCDYSNCEVNSNDYKIFKTSKMTNLTKSTLVQVFIKNLYHKTTQTFQWLVIRTGGS